MTLSQQRSSLSTPTLCKSLEHRSLTYSCSCPARADVDAGAGAGAGAGEPAAERNASISTVAKSYIAASYRLLLLLLIF